MEYLCRVAIERIPIQSFLERSKDTVLIDVRSPKEYGHGHIPGAASLPLFTDEERAVVGTAYKQQSREQAIKEGLTFFGPRMRKMVEEVEAMCRLSTIIHHPSSTIIYIYCWRGGMRSGAVAWLLDLYGFSVKVLAGGYKAYRRHVLETIAEPFPFAVLGGYTGSGKTEVLHHLASKGHAVLDLEGLACHKGSAFGKMGMPPQPTQEMFENSLAEALIAAKSKAGSAQPVWIEDESQRIGQLNIPGPLWTTMRQSPLYFLSIPFEERLLHIVEEYGSYDKEGLAECITRISQRLGGLNTKLALEHLAKNEITECFRILLHYYDKHYTKGLHNRPQLANLLVTINAPFVSPSNANLLLPSPATI